LRGSSAARRDFAGAAFRVGFESEDSIVCSKVRLKVCLNFTLLLADTTLR
jgi:hypothetical protein